MAKNTRVDEWIIDWDNKEIYIEISVYDDEVERHYLHQKGDDDDVERHYLHQKGDDDVERHYLHQKGDDDDFYTKVIRLIRIDAQNELRKQWNEMFRIRSVK